MRRLEPPGQSMSPGEAWAYTFLLHKALSGPSMASAAPVPSKGPAPKQSLGGPPRTAAGGRDAAAAAGGA